MHTIILAGGSGTRLWPLSREKFPKQFLKLEPLDNKSLFQETLERASLFSNPSEILVVTNKDLKFLVMGEIEESGLNIPEKNILVEPFQNNTLAAISLGMTNVQEKALILPSDHYIDNPQDFFSAVEEGKELSDEGLVTFGITPTSANTGYGYIKYSKRDVIEFKEKPSKETAEKYINEGYLWNSGIFLFSRNIFENELKMSLNISHIPLEANDLYSILPSTSIDFAILENSTNIKTVPANIQWSDVGSFDSFLQIFPRDSNSNLLTSNVEAYNTNNSLIYSYEDKLITTYGISDLIIIDSDDALLICPKNYSQNIKEIVGNLKERGDERAYTHTTVYRPWGSYTVLEDKPNFKVKRLTIYPGKKLSLQKHQHRSEHWVIVKGKAEIINGDEKYVLEKNQSTYVPKQYIHRLSNSTNENLEVIETQSGEYLGEDDIERFDDIWGRK